MPQSRGKKRNQSDRSRSDARSHPQYWPWIVLIAAIVIVSAVRIRLLNVPFERDEGEYAYIGQLMLRGIPPYEAAYSMKLPGIYAVYALIMAIFGQTIPGVHVGLLLANIATIVLVFLLARRVFDLATAALTGVGFAFLSLSPAGHGLSANAEHFVLLPAIGGILLMLRGLDSGRLRTFFLSGILLGVAYVIKQHGAFFAAFAGLYMAANQLRVRPIVWRSLVARVTCLALGFAIPYALVCLAMLGAGVFGKFWFWTFTYAQKYASQITLMEGLKYYLADSLDHVIKRWLPIWILAGAGLMSPLWDRKSREARLFTIGFPLLSLLSVCPGYFFRRHYFILLLPALAILAALAVTSLIRLVSRATPVAGIRALPAALFIGALGFSVLRQGDMLFFQTPNQVSRAVYGIQPFPESVEIARYIREHTDKDDLIAVVGSEPQIYFYAGRRAAVPFIYMYPLIEPHERALGMQKQMIATIKRTEPKYIVFVMMPTSWAVWPDSPLLILEWTDRYTRERYRTVGLVEILDTDLTDYYWDDDVSLYSPHSLLWIGVFQRVE